MQWVAEFFVLLALLIVGPFVLAWWLFDDWRKGRKIGSID